MAKNRFAPRGPSKKVIVLLAAVVVAALVSVVAFVLAAAPSPLSPGESYSGETDVKASVFVPSARWNPASEAIELSAIVTARIDVGATCTLTASNGPTVKSDEVKAIADASTMTCANMSVSVPESDSGKWDIIVTYTAAEFTAVSEPMIVEVGA